MNSYSADLHRYRELGAKLAASRDLAAAERTAEEIAKLLRPPPVDAIGGPMPDHPRPLRGAVEIRRRIPAPWPP